MWSNRLMFSRAPRITVSGTVRHKHFRPPRGCSMDAVGQHAPSETPNLAKPAWRVLVIDDDDCVGAAIQSILARRKSKTEIVSRAHAGIHALESSRFDVVLVDLFMPGMSGLDAITHIRRGSTIPIIAMSGFRLRKSLNSLDYLGMAM